MVVEGNVSVTGSVELVIVEVEVPVTDDSEVDTGLLVHAGSSKAAKEANVVIINLVFTRTKRNLISHLIFIIHEFLGSIFAFYCLNPYSTCLSVKIRNRPVFNSCLLNHESYLLIPVS